MKVNISTPKMGVDINTPKMNVGLGVQKVFEKDHSKLTNRDLDDQHPISAITGLQEALDNAGVTQIYMGIDEPTDEEILIWIDTSVPIINNQLITADNMEFITANNENFILKEEI